VNSDEYLFVAAEAGRLPAFTRIESAKFNGIDLQLSHQTPSLEFEGSPWQLAS
jgi:hypothetical protein